MSKQTDQRPETDQRPPVTPHRQGEDQVTATRRTLRETGLNRSALDAIEAGNDAIDRQTGRK